MVETFILIWAIACTQMYVTISILVSLASLRCILWLVRRWSGGYINWKYSVCYLGNALFFLAFSILLLVIQLDRKYEYIERDSTARRLTEWVKVFYFAMWVECGLFRLIICFYDFITRSSIWNISEQDEEILNKRLRRHNSKSNPSYLDSQSEEGKSIILESREEFQIRKKVMAMDSKALKKFLTVNDIDVQSNASVI